MPWQMTLVSLPARIGMLLAVFGRPFHGCSGRLLDGVARVDGQARFAQCLAALFHARALKPDHERHLEPGFSRRADHAVGDYVALHYAAEDVYEDRLDAGVLEDDLKTLFDLLDIGPAAHVEKIRRASAGLLDHVHRRHRQARAVHETADIAGHGYVAQAQAPRACLALIVFVGTLHELRIRPAKERVVVEYDLRVERREPTRGRHRQRVDLGPRP